MKKFIIIFIVILATFTVRAQGADNIVNALKAGNATEVSSYFDKILDIKFPEKDEVKSIGKNQAGIALKSFFDNNNVNGFTLFSQREMSGTMYISGKLNNGGEGYKVSIVMKTKEGRPQITTVRIG